MNITFIFAIGGLLFFTAVFLIGYSFLARRPNLEERIYLTEQPTKRRFDFMRYVRRSEKVFKDVGGFIPRSPEEMSRQEQRLAQAGIRRKDGPLILYGIKIALAIILFIVLPMVSTVRENPVLMIAAPILIGAMVPDLFLNRMIRNRKDNLQRALPDALDLSVVCVEAGLGLDQALLRIGQELGEVYPDLSSELQLYAIEVNAGKKRADALRNLGVRTDVDDIKAFSAVLIQTDRFGTSVAQSLRVFSDTMRTKRRQRAEERAAQMSIKMIPPLVFFIFPSIFVVTIGPAIIRIVTKLVPGLK